MANLFHSSAAASVPSIICWISCHQKLRFKTQTGGQREAWNLKPQQILDRSRCYIFVFFIAWAVCCQPAWNGWLVWGTWVWQFYLVSIFCPWKEVWNSADILIDPAVLGSCSIFKDPFYLQPFLLDEKKRRKVGVSSSRNSPRWIRSTGGSTVLWWLNYRFGEIQTCKSLVILKDFHIILHCYGW